jgi:ATP-dependent RNA helicase DeaD
VGLAKLEPENSRFGLPILQLIDTNATTAVQAVILVPTRELGHQIF